MPRAPASRRRRWLLVLALAAPVALCGWWLWRTTPDAPAGEYEAALDRALEPVLEQHAAETKLGLSTARQTRRLARQLAMDSVPYLAPADLELWAQLRLDIATRSPDVCARLWKGADDELIGRAVAELGADRLRTWSEMLARGLARRLERKPAPEPPPGTIERGMAAVSATLSTAQRAELEADLRERAPSDARACQSFLTLSRGVQQLEPALRIDVYRAFSRQLRGSSRPASPAASR